MGNKLDSIVLMQKQQVTEIMENKINENIWRKSSSKIVLVL